MALIGTSAVGFLLADGEKRRLKWIGAMRRCLLRLSDVIRYEQRGVCALLCAIDLHTTQQERELTRLLHACAEGLREKDTPRICLVYAKESAKIQGYGVLGKEDRAPFEQVIGDLGELALREQIRAIEEADERLRRREATLEKDGTQRIRLIQTLGVCCGAGLFLVLI